MRNRLLRIVGTLVVTGLGTAYLVWKIDVAKTWHILTHAKLAYFLVSLAVMVVTVFPMAWRWQRLLRNVEEDHPRGKLTEYLFLSWFVNCIVPAKLGDLYRAYLLRGNFGASISRTVGTIFIERVTDTMVEIEGEAMRGVTWVVVEEVKSGDWGIGGNALRTEDVLALAAGAPA